MIWQPSLYYSDSMEPFKSRIHRKLNKCRRPAWSWIGNYPTVGLFPRSSPVKFYGVFKTPGNNHVHRYGEKHK